MKQLKLSFILLFIFIPCVKAAGCSNADKVALGKEAVEVKMKYEEVVEVMDPDLYDPPEGLTHEEFQQTYSYFKVSFLNLTPNLEISYTIDGAIGKKNITYDITKNGTFSFNKRNLTKSTKITYKVVGSSKSGCPYQTFHQGVYVLPAYNYHYSNIKCQQYPEFELCKKYLNTVVSDEDFEKKFKSYIDRKEKQEQEKNKKKENLFSKILSFVKENIIIILFAVTLVGGLVIGFVMRYRKRRVI
jgi:hypothetical protein